MFICGVVLRDAFVFKRFWNFSNQFECDFLTLVFQTDSGIVLYDARVRPSIIGYRIWCCGAQEMSWMARRISRTCLYIYIPLCWLLYSVVLRTWYGYCPVVCYVFSGVYSDAILYKTDIVLICVKIY